MKQILPFEQIPQFSKTDIEYAKKDTVLSQFCKYPAQKGQFSQIISDKKKEKSPRGVLVDVLKRQYEGFPKEENVIENIKKLEFNGAFTIVTAHQPCLFLGPLYYVYKALSCIKYAQAAEAETGHPIVPVFVLGSEDHDLEELNFANVFGKKLVWQPEEGGAVGSMSTEKIDPILEELSSILGQSENAEKLISIFKNAYNGERNFAEATQYILNYFFGKLGLLVLNMNCPELKQFLKPLIRQELLENIAQKLVLPTISQLESAGFKAQAMPRDINFFYLQKGSRERIVFENDVYKVLNTNVLFTKEEILEEVENHPERFSPNVVLRPLFQEMVLPNLAYIGGGGEIAYWLERKNLFDHFSVNFPMLLRRHSVLWVEPDLQKKVEKTGLQTSDFFSDLDALNRKFLSQNSETEISLNKELAQLKQIFDSLADKAKKADATLEAAVRSEETKFTGALSQWESRLTRVEKQKHETALNQIKNIREKLFPNGNLQERSDSFIPLYLKYGDSFFEKLLYEFEVFDEENSGLIVLK